MKVFLPTHRAFANHAQCKIANHAITAIARLAKMVSFSFMAHAFKIVQITTTPQSSNASPVMTTVKNALVLPLKNAQHAFQVNSSSQTLMNAYLNVLWDIISHLLNA